MNKILRFLYILFTGFALWLMPMVSNGQVGKFYHEQEALDTVSASQADTFLMAKTLTDIYEYAVQIEARQISGTSSGSAYLEVSDCVSCSDWTIIETLSISGTTDTVYTGTFKHLRARVRIAADGTVQSTEGRVNWVFKRSK